MIHSIEDSIYISKLGRETSPNLYFWCPGCNEHHSFTKNYAIILNRDSITILPAIRSGVNDEKICFLKIENNQLIYDERCYHSLRGQTIPMTPIREPKEVLP